MITVVILNIIVIFFAYLESRKIFNQGLKVSFIIIFVFLAIRHNYGNDYGNYFQGFTDINKFKYVGIFDKDQHFEFGWVLLCRIFEPIGFYGLIAALSLFECIVYYKFIKKYVPVSYYWFAVFLYVFNVGFMLVHLSALRQSLAVGIFLLSFEYMFKKDFLRYCICIGIASAFHSSALFMLPVFAIGYFNFKINKSIAIFCFSIFIMLFLLGDSLLPILTRLANQTFEKYNIYQDSSKLNSGIGLIVNGAMLVFILYRPQFQNRKFSVLLKMAILSFFFLPIGLILVITQRVAIYFSPAIISIYPITLIRMKDPLLKYSFGVLVILFSLYNFILFFNSEIWQQAYSTYQTIFSG